MRNGDQISALEEAIRFALLNDDPNALCPVPRYLNHPDNPWQNPEQPPEEAPSSVGSSARYQLVLEALLTFMRETGFDPSLATQFAAFMHAYDFHLRGYDEELFRQPKNKLTRDSPQIWTIKAWLAVAVEAYVELDGAKDRKSATLFISECLMPNRGRGAVEKCLTATQKRSKTSLAGVIEDWNRDGRRGSLPLAEAQAVFNQGLVLMKGPYSVDQRVGDHFVITALNAMARFGFISWSDRVKTFKHFRTKAAIQWPYRAPA